MLVDGVGSVQSIKTCLADSWARAHSHIFAGLRGVASMAVRDSRRGAIALADGLGRFAVPSKGRRICFAESGRVAADLFIMFQ